ASLSLAGLGEMALAAPGVSLTIGAGLSGSLPSGPASSIQRTTSPSLYDCTTLKVTWGALGSCLTLSETLASSPLARAGPPRVNPPLGPPRTRAFRICSGSLRSPLIPVPGGLTPAVWRRDVPTLCTPGGGRPTDSESSRRPRAPAVLTEAGLLTREKRRFPLAAYCI